MQPSLFGQENKLIVSIFDFTGNWPKPYIEHGYPVILQDIQKEECILRKFNRLLMRIDEAMEAGYIPYGLIAAPPCTHTATSGAKHFIKKDTPKSGYEPFIHETEEAQFLFLIVLHLVDLYAWNFWVMEQPKSRLKSLLPEFQDLERMKFNPCDYGDPYKKETYLYGNFNTDLPKNEVDPLFVEYTKKDGSITKFAPQFTTTGGKSKNRQNIRSATPAGFANAFFQANQ